MARVDFTSNNTTWILAFLLLLSFRIYLINETPAIYSWDAFTRLWEDKTLFVRHWLPVPQIPIFLASLFNFNLFFLRFVYALVAVMGAMFFGLFISRYWGKQIGLTTAILTSLLPSYTMFSIVPFQECFFIFFLGIFLLFWVEAYVNPNRKMLFFSSSAILMAELCRYEAWIFVMVAFVGIVIRRQWRLFPALIPGIIFPIIWLLILKVFDFADGPPRTQQSFIEFTHKTDLFVNILSNFFTAVKSVTFYLFIELALIGIPFMFWGIVISWRKGGITGRELQVFLFILYFLSIARAANSGVHTIRMQTLFNFIAVAYLVIGLNNVSNTLMKKASNIFFFSILIAIAVNFSTKSYRISKKNSLLFLPEAKAASLLVSFREKGYDAENVMIIPREIPNEFGESAIGAIFANSFILDHRDSKWIFHGKPHTRENVEPSYILSYNKEERRYVLSKLIRKSR